MSDDTVTTVATPRRWWNPGAHWWALPRVPPSPGLNRFTAAYAVSSAADALVTISLAGSLFFSVSPDASRRQILIYLVVTMAPFAVVAPLIGPGIDRFRRGHRWIAAIIFTTRAVVSVLLAFALFDLAFYFFALGLLVANKASGVLKQALLPGLVDDETYLIAANSRLSVISTATGALGGALGAALTALGDSTWPLYAAGALFVWAAVISVKLPRPHTAAEIDDVDHLDEREYQDVHRPLITASAAAYTVIRAVVGAFVFGLAFTLRRASEPAWMYGLALVCYGAGAYLGNVFAPVARRRFGEDRLIAASLAGLTICVAFGAAGASRALIVIVAAVMGAATTIGRLGFDSMVQRYAPLALHGRSFSLFETQFQLGWVLGATFATAAAVPTQISLVAVAGVLIPTTALYLRAARDAARFAPPRGDDLYASARERLGSAEHWLASERPAAAVVDAAAAVDLLVAAGACVPRDLWWRLAMLRRDAVDPERSPTGGVDDDAVRSALADVRTQLDALGR